MKHDLVLYASWHSVEKGDAVTEQRYHLGPDHDGPVCGEASEFAAREEYTDALRTLLGEFATGSVWCPHCSRWLAHYLLEGDPPLVT